MSSPRTDQNPIQQTSSQMPQTIQYNSQNPMPAQPVGVRPGEPPSVVRTPIIPIKTNRSMAKLFWLGLITLGIYDIVIYTEMSNEINRIAGPYDHKKTMNYCLLLFLIGPITLGIADLVWGHRISARIGDELERRGKPRSMSAGQFWGWDVFGQLILVGWFIYTHKLCQAMNELAADYNVRG